MTRFRLALMLAAAGFAAACATTPETALMPENVPVLYEEPAELAKAEDPCLDMQLEFAQLNQGIGDYPEDTPPEGQRSLMERADERLRDLVMDALTNEIDPVIQAYRILTDASETERKLAKAKRRGLIRRAYVMGHMDAAGCERGEDAILVIANTAASEDILPSGVTQAEVRFADTVDGPPVQMAALPPETETPAEIEVEYVIILEYLDPDDPADAVKFAELAPPPRVDPKPAQPRFDPNWEDDPEPVLPDSDVPIVP